MPFSAINHYFIRYYPSCWCSRYRAGCGRSKEHAKSFVALKSLSSIQIPDNMLTIIIRFRTAGIRAGFFIFIDDPYYPEFIKIYIGIRNIKHYKLIWIEVDLGLFSFLEVCFIFSIVKIKTICARRFTGNINFIFRMINPAGLHRFGKLVSGLGVLQIRRKSTRDHSANHSLNIIKTVIVVNYCITPPVGAAL